MHAMHKSNCGVHLWKTICENDSFFGLYFSSDFCKMTMKKTFLIFNWFVVYNSFQKRNQREIYIFDEKNIKREKFLCKNEHSNDSKKTFNVRTAVHKHCWSNFHRKIMFFIWFLQNENEKNNSAIQLLLTIFRKRNQFVDLYFQWKKHQTISLKRFIRVNSFRSIKFSNQVSEKNRSNATSRHFDRITNRKSSVHSIVRSWMQFFWHQKTISSMHLIVRSQMQSLWHHIFDAQPTSFNSRQTDNRQRASDDIDIRCSSLTIRQSSACIWPFHGRVQQFGNQTTASASDGIDIRCSSDNQTIVSASNLIAIGCSNLGINCLSSNRDGAGCSSISDIKTISPVHLIVSRSNAAVLTSHSTASAFDGIGIRCSPDNQTVVRTSDCFTIECSIFGINSLSAHSLVAALHSFDHFFTSSRTVDWLSYTFIWSNFF